MIEEDSQEFSGFEPMFGCFVENCDFVGNEKSFKDHITAMCKFTKGFPYNPQSVLYMGLTNDQKMHTLHCFKNKIVENSMPKGIPKSPSKKQALDSTPDVDEKKDDIGPPMELGEDKAAGSHYGCFGSTSTVDFLSEIMKRSRERLSGSQYKKRRTAREKTEQNYASSMQDWLHRAEKREETNQKEESGDDSGPDDTHQSEQVHTESDARDSDADIDDQGAVGDNRDLKDETVEFELCDIFSDVASWPSPLPRKLRLDLVQNGSCSLQNIQGPFDEVDGRSLNSSWFTKTMPNGQTIPRSWLLYSLRKKSAFCFPCLLFPELHTGAVSSFASTGFNKWKKLNPRIQDHEKSPVHIHAFLEWKDMEKRQHAGKFLDQELEDQVRSETEKWRDVLKRVLDVVLLLSKQNLPFRGHRETDDSENKGNFLEVVHLLSKYDAVLREHLVRCSLSSTRTPSYLSYQTQNEFISIIGDKVRDKIMDEVRQAKYYGILSDGTPDISHVDQMSIILRYVVINDDSALVKESFVDFVPTAGKTAQHVTDTILGQLHRYNLNIQDCRAQAYDNASTMSGQGCIF